MVSFYKTPPQHQQRKMSISMDSNASDSQWHSMLEKLYGRADIRSGKPYAYGSAKVDYRSGKVGFFSSLSSSLPSLLFSSLLFSSLLFLASFLPFPLLISLTYRSTPSETTVLTTEVGRSMPLAATKLMFVAERSMPSVLQGSKGFQLTKRKGGTIKITKWILFCSGSIMPGTSPPLSRECGH